MGFLLLCCSNSQVKPQFQPDVEDPHQMLQDFPDAPIVMQCGAPSSACPDVSRLPGVAFSPKAQATWRGSPPDVSRLPWCSYHHAAERPLHGPSWCIPTSLCVLSKKLECEDFFFWIWNKARFVWLRILFDNFIWLNLSWGIVENRIVIKFKLTFFF